MITKSHQPFDSDHPLAGVEGPRVKFDAQRMVDGKMCLVEIDGVLLSSGVRHDGNPSSLVLTWRDDEYHALTILQPVSE